MPSSADLYFEVFQQRLGSEPATTDNPALFIRPAPDRLPPTSMGPPLDLQIVISPSQGGSTFDFSDPANSGHIPGV